MAARQAAGAVETPPVRIRPAQSNLHAVVEAGAYRTGARRPRRRLGRSAHADDRRAEAARGAAGRDLYIERDDFMENPPKKFFRLSPGTEVRLRYAYFVKCTDVIKNAAGEVIELRCSYDPATRGGNAPDGRKVKATMHWLPAAQSIPAEIRIYNQLFSKPVLDAANFAADLNPQSLEVLKDARVEPAIAESNSPEPIQFERQGYFVGDPGSTPDRPVFNRTIGLRDTFAKEVGGKS